MQGNVDEKQRSVPAGWELRQKKRIS